MKLNSAEFFELLKEEGFEKDEADVPDTDSSWTLLGTFAYCRYDSFGSFYGSFYIGHRGNELELSINDCSIEEEINDIVKFVN